MGGYISVDQAPFISWVITHERAAIWVRWSRRPPSVSVYVRVLVRRAAA